MAPMVGALLGTWGKVRQRGAGTASDPHSDTIHGIGESFRTALKGPSPWPQLFSAGVESPDCRARLRCAAAVLFAPFAAAEGGRFLIWPARRGYGQVGHRGVFGFAAAVG